MINEVGSDIISSGKRSRDDTELDLTPMIDVVFLLLAFFIVVSKLDQQVQLQLPTAAAGISVIEQSAVVLLVTKGDSPDEPDIYKGKEREAGNLVVGDPEAQETEVVDYVMGELEEKEEKIKFALIKIEGDVKNRQVQLVKAAVSKALANKQRSDTVQLYVAIEHRLTK